MRNADLLVADLVIIALLVQVLAVLESDPALSGLLWLSSTAFYALAARTWWRNRRDG